MSVTSLLPALLTHPDRVTHDAVAACDPEDLRAAAEYEQVVPLALAALESIAGPHAHLAMLRDAARKWTLYEALQRRAVGDVLDAAPGARMLFFKGASLAYSLYPAPSARMRHDWDLLVDLRQAASVEGALLGAGFEKDLKTPGGIRARQNSYRRPIGDGECTIDLHTGLFNAPGIARRISFDDLYATGIALPSLHAHARGTSEVDALVIACLHRLVHHSSETRLIWDYDVHLLTTRLQGSFDLVMRRAAEWHAEGLLALEIGRVAARFDVPLPASVADAIRGVPAQAAGFARENRSRAQDFVIDWRELGWRDRASLVRETFLPDPAFVRAASGSNLPVPLLYVRRLLRGASGWLRSRPRDSDN